MQKLSETVKALQLLPVQVITETTTGTGVNVEAYNDDALIVLSLGTFVSDPSVTVTIEKSATLNGSYSTIGTFTAATAAGEAAIGVDLTGVNFIRAVATVTGGTSPEIPVSVIAISKLSYQANTLNSATVA